MRYFEEIDNRDKVAAVIMQNETGIHVAYRENKFSIKQREKDVKKWIYGKGIKPRRIPTTHPDYFKFTKDRIRDPMAETTETPIKSTEENKTTFIKKYL